MKKIYTYGAAQKLYSPFKKLESKFDIHLKAGNYYILRFDGKEMTAGFKIKHQAINDMFFKTMRESFYNFVDTFKKTLFVYSFSDEISILFKSKKTDDDFSRSEKLLSLLSSQLTLNFYKSAIKYNLDLKNKDWLFDARILEVTKEDTLSYFQARQAFAIDKYLTQLKGQYGIDYKLHKSDDIIEALKLKGVEYSKLNPEYAYGIMYSNKTSINPFEFAEDPTKLRLACFGT